MPNTQTAKAVRLEFAPRSLEKTSFSGAAFSDNWLWVAGDENCGIDPLGRLPAVGDGSRRYGSLSDLPLADLLELPGTVNEEADLEIMAVAKG